MIIKVGLAHMPPLTLAGLRYFAAFLLLLPAMALNGGLARNPAPGHWWQLFLMGLCAYPLSNGALFWGLQYVPATTGAFLFSLHVPRHHFAHLRDAPALERHVGALAEPALVGDGVAPVDGLGPVPDQLHGARPGHAGALQVPDRRVPEVMREPLRHAGVLARGEPRAPIVSDRRAATLDGVKPGWCARRIYAIDYLVRTPLLRPSPRQLRVPGRHRGGAWMGLART
ncbi:MAG: hypothetical protein A2X52_06815 [Candidatus Rokubacteria bacterium GWC2_70_16]|nr:MAG: hypothetical protein A2X52_06815 [Candidatus Rokubacteria bacterium GWC2_70_16]